MEALPEIAGAATVGQQCSTLDLEQLLQEGDESTWNLDDWDWDPIQLFAEPKGTPNCFACQAFKRHKPAADAPASGQAATAAADTAGCSYNGLSGREVMAAAIQQPSLVAPCSYHGPIIQQLQQPLLQQQQVGQQLQPQLPGANAHQHNHHHHHGHNHHPQQQHPQQQPQQQQEEGVAPGQAAWLAMLLDPQHQPPAPASLQAPQPPQQQQQPSSHQAAVASAAAAAAAAIASGSGTWPAGPQHQAALAAAASALQQMGLSLTPEAMAAAAAAAVASSSGAAHPAPAPAMLPTAGAAVGAHTPSLLHQWPAVDPSVTGAAALPARAGAAAGAGAGSGSCCAPAGSTAPCTAAAGIHGLLWDMASSQPATASSAVASLQHPAAAGPAGLQQLQLPTQHVPAGVPTPHAASSSSSGAAAAAAAAAAAQQQEASPTAGGDLEVAGVLLEDCDDDRLVCQVPGCGKDLTGLKDYHQRYKICDVHIKLPQVMKNGRLQRFCQQCGRFHDLSAFDGNRKSCREQLQKHNARRRRRAQLEQNMSIVESLTAAVDEKSDVGRLLQNLLANPLQLHAMRVLLGVPSHPALPKAAPFPAEHAGAMETAVDAAAAGLGAGSLAAAAAAGGAAGAGSSQLATAAAVQLAAAAVGQGAAAAAAAAVAGEPASYQVARDILDHSGSFAPSFDSDTRVERLTLKLFSVTPQDLPPDLRQQLTGWLAGAPQGLEGYIRPGCVMLSLHLTLSNACWKEAKAHGLNRLLSNLLAPSAHPFWHTTSFLVQLFGQLAFVSRGRLMGTADVATPSAAAAKKLPVVTSVGPLCCSGGGRLALRIKGVNVFAPGVQVLVKAGGKHLYLGPGRLVAGPGAAAAAPAKGCCPSGCSSKAGAAAVTAACCQKAAEAPQQQQKGEEEVKVQVVKQEDVKEEWLQEQQQEVEVVVGAVPAGPQLVWVEVASGAYHTPPVPLLLVQDEAVAQELQQLQEAASRLLPPAEVQALLVDTATVLQHMAASHPQQAPTQQQQHSQGKQFCGSGSGASAMMSHYAIAAKARRIIALACDMGWVALARSVLPLVTACGACAADIVRQIHAATAKDGLSLLHRAVRSGNPELVRGILDWGAERGYKWPVLTPGPLGVTALHLAALLDDAGKVALMLLDECEGPGAFSSTSTQDGVTPFHLALQQGHFTVDQVIQELRLLPAIRRVSEHKPASGWDLLRSEAAAAAAAAGGAPGAKGGRGAKGMRNSKQLDACLNCQSVLPPLLVSIIAHCAGCGMRQPCVNPDGSRNNSSDNGTAAGAAGGGCGHGSAAPTHQQQRVQDGAAAAPAAAAAVPAAGTKGRGRTSKRQLEAASSSMSIAAVAVAGAGQGGCGCGCGSAVCRCGGDGSCTHEHGRVLSVTAMCQTCHANRVLEVV